MKNIKQYLQFILLFGLFTFSSCDLEEEPPYLTSVTIYEGTDNAESALNGLYLGLADWGTYRIFFPKALYCNSGLYMSTQWSTPDLCDLRPLQGNFIVNISWDYNYKVISRANDVIAGVNAEGADETIQDIVGQAYFLRAFTYFNMVRLWGDIPLRTVPVDSETLNVGKEDSKVIFDQIIMDCKDALTYMNGAKGPGYPKQYAANMLLAKVYMHLATNPDLQSESANYWQLAYDEAKKVYGKYSLVGDYASLFDGRTSDNTVESIFELQLSPQTGSHLFRDWSLRNYGDFTGNMGLRINPEVYDRHVAAYPNDSERLGSTFVTEYEMNDGNTSLHYPAYNNGSREGSNYNQSFTIAFKPCIKDKSVVSNFTGQNTVLYRYGDLLLMLAEISNELNNGEQLGYVTEVLDRVNVSPQSGYSGGQDSFREAIMAEYNFELLTEWQDWFINRRRGHQWFLDHVINPHNNYAKKNSFDRVLPTDASIMHLPIGANEIGSNPLIN